MIEIKLPGLGENIESGTIAKIHVAIGDTITKDQIILELESEKATVEVPSPESGIIQELLVKEGDTAQVGQVLIKLANDGQSQGHKVTESQESERDKNNETRETEPDEQAALSSEEKIAASKQKETETQEEEEEKQTIDDRPQTVDQKQIEVTGSQSHKVTTEQPSDSLSESADVPAAPSVRRFAREIGINIGKVPGSGPAGRISVDDVKAYAKKINTNRSAGGPSVASEPLPDFSKWGETEDQAMNTIRRRTAERLSFSWQTVPHVTQFIKADITELEKLRKQYSTPDLKLTITPFILKVLAAALKNFPKFNASVDMAGQKIIFKKYIHIGVAVDTENGLLVPVIRNVDQKGIVALAKELQDLAQRARDKKLSIEDMQGGTFTLTNLGGIGGGAFTPIINWPEVAILGVSRAQKEPSVDSDLCAPRLMLPLSLSYDHRLIDGADGARFIKWVAEAIKQPFMLELG